MSNLETLQQCLHCPNARCAQFCPCGNDIPNVIDAYKRGEEEEAARILHQTNPFPELTSLLCDHERQCRGHCIRGIRGEPVDFPALEHWLSERYPTKVEPGKSLGKKIAIIGAGPSALSAAYFLIEAGFAVEIMEKEAYIGGAVLTGIPSFRFDKKPLKDIEKKLVDAGVKFRFNTALDRASILALKEDYDEVILAIGAEKENRLNTPECPDISSALPLLYKANLENDLSYFEGKKHVVVMGGGNVAMDAARLSARQVKTTLIYRRDEASMPAAKVEIAEAKEDGVAFSPLTNVAGYDLDEQGRLRSLTVVSMQLGEKDESGRPSFSVIEGSERPLPCDGFIMAIGEKSALPDLLQAESAEALGLLAIGDCSYGAKNIAAAIKDGRLAAQKLIEKYR